MALKRDARGSRCALPGAGDLYPDVIVGARVRGDARANIKLHHNVGGLPEEPGVRAGREPLRRAVQGPVRRVGEMLGLPENIMFRHPFPGAGAGGRSRADVTAGSLRVLRRTRRDRAREWSANNRTGMTAPGSLFAADRTAS